MRMHSWRVSSTIERNKFVDAPFGRYDYRGLRTVAEQRG